MNANHKNPKNTLARLTLFSGVTLASLGIFGCDQAKFADAVRQFFTGEKPASAQNDAGGDSGKETGRSRRCCYFNHNETFLVAA